VEFAEAVLYRLAFALADQLREADDPNHPGRWRSNPAAGGNTSTIITEVLDRLAVADAAGREIVREAVEDALARRWPRW
jgi:hypothetical protein